ncbi:MAG: hypothetical protein ACEQSX_07945 [Baekduiaceae bacterium]
MRPLRSLRAKLTFLFFAMTLAAVFVVYVYVTPQLESSLRQEKLDSLATGAERWSPPVPTRSGPSARARTSTGRSAGPPTARTPA